MLNIASGLTPEQTIAMAQIRDHGGVPAERTGRSRMIIKLLESKLLEPETINGRYPMTLSGYRLYLRADIGCIRYGSDEHTKLRRHNEGLAKEARWVSFPKSFDMHDAREFLSWCNDHSIAVKWGRTPRTTKENPTSHHYSDMWYCFDISRDDYPLAALKWI
jgi:hypothetical protein